MPDEYVTLRDKFIASGMSRDAAKAKAAKIYNAMRPLGAKPVGRH